MPDPGSETRAGSEAKADPGWRDDCASYVRTEGHRDSVRCPFSDWSRHALRVRACAHFSVVGLSGSDATHTAERAKGVPATDASQAATSRSAVTSLLDVGTSEVLGLRTQWNGDFDEVADGRRRFIRVLVPVSRTYYYADGEDQKGIAFDSLREFEQTITKLSAPQRSSRRW